MKTNKLKFLAMAFFSLVLALLSEAQCAEAVNRWVENLNFTYNKKFIIDQNGESSLDNTTWHIDQGLTLFNSYENCQIAPRRNVMRAKVSIIYSTGNSIEMISLYKRVIYINGFLTEDVRNINYSELYQSNLNFIALSNVCNDINELKSILLIPEEDPCLLSESILRRSKYCHTESTFFMQLRKEANFILNAFENVLNEKNINKSDITVNGIVLNMASKNDMCTDCRDMSTRELNDNNLFINEFKKNFINKSINYDDNLSCSILFSGMTQLKSATGSSRSQGVPSPRKLGSPVDILPNSKKLYFMKSPCYSSQKDSRGFFNFDGKSGWEKPINDGTY